MRLRGLNLELERLNLESLVVLLLACPSQSMLLRGNEGISAIRCGVSFVKRGGDMNRHAD